MSAKNGATKNVLRWGKKGPYIYVNYVPIVKIDLFIIFFTDSKAIVARNLKF